jgi:serine/threonine protein kinase
VDQGVTLPSETPSNSSSRISSQREAQHPDSSSEQVAGPEYASLSEQKTVISKRRPSDRPPQLHSPGCNGIGAALEGQQLGHFQLEEYVGGGGMGVVFRAVDTMLGRTVAVKVVANDTTDEETLRRFRNEAQSAARLDHPNIARVYYVGEDRGWYYIVFEYIDGINVRDLVAQSGPLSLEESLSYMVQVADALDHASERAVVHRDIKPSNILVMRDGRAKLVDMGLARLHQVESNANDLTATGVTLGTFDYISPEQARDPRLADVRSDLYSLGCTFYYMLTGLPPFPEGTVLQKLLSHSSEPPPDPRDIRRDLPDEVATIALRLMAKQPSQRYQRPLDVAHEALLVADHLGFTLGDRGLRVRLAPRVSWWTRIERHLPWLVPILLLVGAVFGYERLQEPNPATRAAMQPRVGKAPAAAEPKPDVPQVQGPPAERESLRGPTADEDPTSVDAGQGETTTETYRVPPADAESPSAIPPSDTVETLPAGKPSDETSDVEEQPSVAAEPVGSQDVEQEDEEEASAELAAVEPGADKPLAAPAENVLIVRPGVSAAGEPNVVATLDAALRRVTADPSLTTIELHFAQRDERPLALHWPADRPELTIKAGPDFEPLIVFHPSPYDLAAERRMLNLIGGRFRLEGLHFRVELPYGMSEGWTLFHLNSVDRIRLTNCTMTVGNPFLSPSSFFTVRGPQPSAMESSLPAPALLWTLIELENCVARGQATLVRASEGLPFWLTWRQGFLATSEYLAECSGLSAPVAGDAVRLTLDSVTASVDRGLLRLDALDGAVPTPRLRIECTNCVLVHPSSTPLVEYVGVEGGDRILDLFEFEGKDNWYESTETRWRIASVDGEPLEFRWYDVSQPWYHEQNAQRGVAWSAPLPVDRAPGQRRPDDYRIESIGDPTPGCNQNLLPNLPPQAELRPRP